MQIANDISAPRIDVARSGDRFELHVSVALNRLADLPVDASWRLGLAAVIEETNGVLSYWALKHPPGKPDFHHEDCFEARLEAGT